MANLHNITVPYTPLSDMNWSYHPLNPLPWNPALWAFLSICTALPIYDTLLQTASLLSNRPSQHRLTLLIILTTTWSITTHALGTLLTLCVPTCPPALSTLLTQLGAIGTLTGFSLVLYSSLHILVPSLKPRRGMLLMILVNAATMHVPMAVFRFGGARFAGLARTMDLVQVLAFAVQETLLTGAYVHGVRRIAKRSCEGEIKRLARMLAGVQGLVLVLNVLLIILDFAGYEMVKMMLVAVVYALKVRLGRAGLRRLEEKRDVVEGLRLVEKRREREGSRGSDGLGEVVDERSTAVSHGSDGSGGSGTSIVKPYVAGRTDTVEAEEGAWN